MNKQEITINVKDYIVYSLKNTKIFIVFLICFVLFFGSFGIVKKTKELGTKDTRQKQYEDDIEEYRFKENFLKDVVSIEKKLYDDAVEYKNNSYKLNMDYENVVFSTIKFHVKKENSIKNKNDNKNKLYVDGQGALFLLETLKDSSLQYVDWDSLSNKLKVNKVQIRECIETYIDTDEYTMTLLVKWSDQSGAKYIANEILKSFKDNYDKINNTLEYDIVTDKVNTYSTIDMAILDEKVNAENEIASYEKKYEEDLEELDKLEFPKEILTTKEMIKEYLKAFLKYGFLGGILGVMLLIWIQFERFTRKGVIYSVQEYERISGHTLLADWCQDDKENELTRLIIAISAKITEGEKVILLCDMEQEKCEDLFEQLQKKSNIDFVFGSSSDSDTLKKLKEIKYVVPVYLFRQTMLGDILEQEKILEFLGKTVLGCVVV